jgi:glycosyltransferase involved in cell wall biosynthesis
LLNANTTSVENYLFCPENAALLKKNTVLKDRTGAYTKLFGWDLFGGYRLKKFLENHKIKLVHIHDSHALNLYWTAYALGAKVPAVYHKHHNHPIGNTYKYDRTAIRKIICVSRSVYETARQKTNVNKLAIIHSGLMTQTDTRAAVTLKDEFHIPETAILVGMVCALEKEKNIPELIKIAKVCRGEPGESLYFILIGAGNYESRVRSAIEQAGLKQYFFLTGFREDVPALLDQLDIFLFTSLSEGFPLAVLEAMQAGTPVISRDSGGIKEMVLDQETGLIYHTIPEACKKIMGLLANKSEQIRMSGNAKKFVQQFSVEQMIQKTHTLYKEIIS